MWPLRLALVVSQFFFTWSQCLSVTCDVRDSTLWINEPPQALLQHSTRFVSQFQTVPALRDSADFERDKHHGLHDEELYGTLPREDHGFARDESHGLHDEDLYGTLPRGGDSKQHDVQDKENHGKGRDQRVVVPGDSHIHKTFVHGRHDTDDHAQDHHHSPPSTTSTVIALMLVGMLAMFASLFCLVNYPHKNINQVTWTILSSTISLFCSVLIFSALKAVIGMCVREKIGIHGHHLKPNWTVTWFSFAELIFTFILGQSFMVWYRQRHYRLMAWATIGGHMTAFAAIECFGNLYHYAFSSSWQRGCVLVLLASSAMWGLSELASYVRRTYLSPQAKEQQELFIEECDDAGSEYVSLTIGMLISLLARHMITGELPPVHGSPRNKTQTEIWQLFAWATGLILVLVIYTVASHTELRKKNQSGSLAHLAQYTLSMSAGWCLLSWGQWLFWSSVGEYMSETDKMQARMIMAMAFSALVFCFIFIFDFIAANFATQFGMRAIISTMALLLGLAWESVFVLSIESISGHYLELPVQYICCELGLTGILLAVVLPGWVWYVLPKAEEAKLEAEEQFNRA